MSKIIACVDGAPGTTSIVELAAWSAKQLGMQLELLFVIDRLPERAPVSDMSGSIGLGAQETLLDELTVLDERRSKVAQEHGRLLLEAAKRQAAELGVTDLQSRERHGTLVETLEDLERDTALFVLGHHHHTGDLSKRHLDHNLERVVRALHRPILVASESFRAPQTFLIAFDGSVAGRKTVEMVTASALLRGLTCHVVTAGDDGKVVRDQLSWASTTLASAGFEPVTAVVQGEPEDALARYGREQGIDLLVISAYGHSRIRHLIVGSTTTAMLRTSTAPVLVLR